MAPRLWGYRWPLVDVMWGILQYGVASNQDDQMFLTSEDSSSHTVAVAEGRQRTGAACAVLSEPFLCRAIASYMK